MWEKSSAEVGHRVFGPWWHIGEQLTSDYAVGGKLPEYLRQHFL